METLFIVFEGIDGSGKSTLARNVHKILQKNDIKTSLFTEPTTFETGLKIREFLRGEISLSVDEQLRLFIEDRKLSVTRNILPALENGANVILDRYYYSTAAYQSSENFQPEDILKMNQSENFPEPDLLFYLDIDPDDALKRIATRGKAESFEKADELKRIRSAYEKILPQNTVRLDALLAESELAEMASGIILKKV